jgi:hypothetical protein
MVVVVASYGCTRQYAGSIHLVLAGKGSDVEDEFSWIRNAFVEPTANVTACM